MNTHAATLRCLGLALLLALTTAAAEPGPEIKGVGALPNEPVVLPQLRGVICVADPADALAAVPAGFSGVDATRAPLARQPDVAKLLALFLDRPVSLASLQRLSIGVRVALQASGEPFAIAYVPPQDLTAGVVRLVVRRAKLDGALRIEGAKWFAEDAYRAAVPLAAGAEIDAATLQRGVAWLNEHAYRRATVDAEPGAGPGTTRLTLRVQEERPWRLAAGYSNSGTAVTDEDRVSASLAWGNAFGRGDQLGYSFSADPRLAHSRSHSANYTTIFRSRAALTLHGSWSKIESELPAPLTQAGKSWQAGARFGVPLAKTGGWERSLSFAADFKYSDNNLEFAAIPITNNVTHIAQFGATFTTSRRTAERSFALSASLYASPGGLTGRNHGRYFDAARAGAKAGYVYGRIEGQWAQRLPHGFSFSATAAVQAASGPLLGTEQLAGAGSSAVRGYRESTAFGDDGLLVNTELHLPAFSPLKKQDQADVFAFVDGAVLGTRGPGGGTTDLASAGAGLNYAFGRRFSLRAAYGWTLKDLSGVLTPSGHGHLGASLNF